MLKWEFLFVRLAVGQYADVCWLEYVTRCIYIREQGGCTGTLVEGVVDYFT